MKGRWDLVGRLNKLESSKAHEFRGLSSISHDWREYVLKFSQKLQTFLAGRKLLQTELPFSNQLLNEHLEHGFITELPGLKQKGKRWICGRCHNDEQHLFATFPCVHCKKEEGCVYCRKCILMGRVSSCTSLYIWTGPPLPWKNLWPAGKLLDSYLQWDGNLSPGQQEAATLAVKTVQTKGELLIWAVCGAGKTEVLFPAINEALRLERRICIATPRTDVVLELAPRLKKVFPDVPIASLYGGTPDRNVTAPLTISTTHQLFRFHEAFDVMIVDEVDAFPYSFDETLQKAVKHAGKKEATHLYLTATPNEKWQLECQLGKRPYIKIPARYHRHPLPVPVFRWCGNWRKALTKGRIPPVVRIWLEKRLNMKKQVLLFLPNIELMEKSLPLFQQLHKGIEAVHAEDPLRVEKVERMRKKEIPILLTTTILERGVTFPNIDVAILGAEDDIFNEAALVQIAGRVGRSKDYPTGEIVFFHYGRTRAMVRALLQIWEMNKEAAKKGWIDV